MVNVLGDVSVDMLVMISKSAVYSPVYMCPEATYYRDKRLSLQHHQSGLGTILLLLYCTILKHRYNILQYSPPPIRYILQYSPPPIQYIGNNILQYIFYQSIFAEPCRQ